MFLICIVAQLHSGWSTRLAISGSRLHFYSVEYGLGHTIHTCMPLPSSGIILVVPFDSDVLKLIR